MTSILTDLWCIGSNICQNPGYHTQIKQYLLRHIEVPSIRYPQYTANQSKWRIYEKQQHACLFLHVSSFPDMLYMWQGSYSKLMTYKYIFPGTFLYIDIDFNAANAKIGMLQKRYSLKFYIFIKREWK